MKFYLSSYHLGNETDQLLKMLAGTSKKVAYIPNALDFATDLARRKESENKDLAELENLGLKVNYFDLKKYFSQKKQQLEADLLTHDFLWIRGGNVFTLRQAMYLSGFDQIIKKLAASDTNLIYGGFSAGICVLGPSLKGYEIVDGIKKNVYPQNPPIINQGLNLLNYSFAPHYHSNHPESEKIDKLVKYFTNHQILFKTLKDGEVEIIN